MTTQTLLQTYTQFIDSTYATGLTEAQSITNCIISMSGELCEWEDTEANGMDELLEAGDVLYYLTRLCVTLGINTNTLYEDLSFIEFMSVGQIIAKLSDLTKKHLFWGPNPKYDRQQYIELLRPILISILKEITWKIDIDSIIEANIDKLSKRKGITNPLEAYYE